jgi:hypothetical protein
MADKVQRPKPQGGDYRPHYRKREADAYMDQVETELDNYRLTFRAIERQSKVIAALHASIIEQGRLVQIGASGESKYGAMSAGEYIEWVLNKLEGK